MKNVARAKMKFEKKKYILIENYWDADPCEMCVFADRCDEGEFHVGDKMPVNPAENCGEDSYWIHAKDINKENV